MSWSQADRAPVVESGAPKRYPEGTWQSPGYRSAGARAKVALVFFAIAALAAALEALLALQGIGLMGQAANGTATAADFAAFFDTSDGIDGFYLLTVIALAVAFLAWLSRTVDNTPALGAGVPKDSPRWAIGWWFVPIAFLWKPYGVVREAWDRLATDARAAQGNLVIAWWLAWIGATFVSRFALASFSNSTTFEGAVGTLWLLLAADLGLLAAAVLGFLVVREIQARADGRAEQLGFERPLPHAAAAPSAVHPAVAVPAASGLDAGQASQGQHCSSCGARRVVGAQFCSSCGQEGTSRLSASAPPASV